MRRIGAEVAISRSAVVNAGANAQCMHGSRKELGTKLVNKILKELGLK